MINNYDTGNKTVNPFVAGSSPARGAIHLKGLRKQALFFTPAKSGNGMATI